MNGNVDVAEASLQKHNLPRHHLPARRLKPDEVDAGGDLRAEKKVRRSMEIMEFMI